MKIKQEKKLNETEIFISAIPSIFFFLLRLNVWKWNNWINKINKNKDERKKILISYKKINFHHSIWSDFDKKKKDLIGFVLLYNDKMIYNEKKVRHK